MNNKKLLRGLRRSMTGALAVVLAATAMGPLFTVLSSASMQTFDYISDLKTSLSGSSFIISEIVPSAEQTAMGYLSKGNDSLNIFAEESASVEGWRKADRASYMTSVYSDLSSKGIIGGTAAFPLTLGRGYIEYFPWQVTQIGDNYYYNGDINDGVPAPGALSLREMTVAEQDYDSVRGRYELAGEEGTGEYRLNASFSPSKRLFFYKEFYNKFNTQSIFNTAAAKLYNYDIGDDIVFNGDEQTLTVKTGSAHGTGLRLPVSTVFNSASGYLMKADKNTKYQISFKVDVQGGDFYVGVYESSTVGAATVTNPSAIYRSSTDSALNTSESGVHTIEIETSDNAEYIQVSFGVNSKNTTAVFSDIYVGEPRGFVQSTYRYIYEDENFRDTADDFWYDLVFTPFNYVDDDNNDYVTLDYGVAIYEENEEINGKMTYSCIGVTGVDAELDLDYEKVIANKYFRASVNDEIVVTEDGVEKGLQTVTATRDEYHTYRAEPLYEEATSNLEFVAGAPGYFKANDRTYTYTPGSGDYFFIPDDSAAESVRMFTNTVFYYNDVTSNDLFKYAALDYDDEDDNFSVNVRTATPDSVNNAEYCDYVRTVNLIVITAGLGTSVNSSINQTDFSPDITPEVKEAILNAASATYKVPVMVDARLIDSSFGHALNENVTPNLYSLVDELISVNTERSGVSIRNGGVSENIYAFNPSDTAASISCPASYKIGDDIVTGKAGNAYLENSPYYDVYYQIYYENIVRSAHNLAALAKSNVSEGTCLRCIINYKGRRIMSDKKNLRVLDIEPYTNKPSIDELQVASWLPNGYFKDDEGLPLTIANVETAKKYIDLTCMSTAELNGVGDLIIENYDLVYVGASLENLHTREKNGVTYVDYNDESDYMQNKIYTSIGDVHTVGNVNYDGTNFSDIVKGTVEGNTLAGLLSVDYNAITNNIWYVSPGYEFGLRTTGNDITRDVMNQLQEFADAGFPVVFADDLVDTSQINTAFSVRVSTKLVYRGTTGNDLWGKNTAGFKTSDAGSGSGAVYFAFVKAEIIGDIPRGIKPVFTWKWKKGANGEAGTKNTDYGVFYRTEQEAKAEGKNNDWVEPIADVGILTEDQNAKNWYSTIGDWDYLENYYDQNGDGIISGVSLNKDTKTLPYVNLNQDYRYYCDISFEEDKSSGVTVSEPIKYAFIDSGLKLHSNEVNFHNNQSGDIQSFTVVGQRPGQNKAVTVDIVPNPFEYNVYVDNSELKWRHRAKLIVWWSDCKCGSRILTHNPGKLTVTTTNCEDYNLHLDGNINGQQNSTEDANGPNATYTGTCTWTAYITNSYNIPGTSYVRNNSGILPDGVVTVTDNGYERVSDFSVDNTSFLYQFMSNVYNVIDYNAAEELAGNVDRQTWANIFTPSSFPDRSDALRDCLISETPSIAVDEASLTSYPAALRDNNLEFDFVVYSDKDSNGALYEVKLYIDTDHDAVFSASEEVSITYLRAKSGAAAPVTTSENRYLVRSSTTAGGTYNQYTLQKTLPSTYVGIIPWKLVVTDVNNSYYHDSYKGYAYRRAAAGEGTVIKAVQVLPSDHWSNTVVEVRNGVNQLIQKYDKPVVRGIWRPKYETSGISASQAPYDSATLQAAYDGNAYEGSLFLGTGAGRGGSIYENDEAWYLRDANSIKDPDKTNLIYTFNEADFKNDAFYQLCIADDSILDRTVYYEDLDAELSFDDGTSLGDQLRELYREWMQYGIVKYRTHVELWVNPKGNKVPKLDAAGNVQTDYFGNVIYGYEQYDFELDIALTDIYEMNFCWYKNMQAAESNAFLSQYDMLILGFGDSYGHTARQNRALLESVKANLGFNLYAATAIRNYVDSGRPVLFCHDTTNTNVNFLNYYMLNASSWLAQQVDAIQNFWNTTVKEVATKAWYWVRNVVRTIFNKPTLNVPAPNVSQEAELNSAIADSRIRDGYYNNLILRAPLKLDRYGITYEICKQMDQTSGGKTYWEQNNFRAGHVFNYLLGNTYPSAEYPNAPTDKTTRGVISEAEMLGHGFVVAYEPGSAVKTVVNARNDEQVQYTNYNNANAGTKVIDGVETPITFTGKQVKGDYIYDTQGFTKWTIARYLSNNLDKDKDKYMPATVPGNVGDKHRSVYRTTAITQTNKGSLTTYPYDVNSSDFGGVADANGDGKIAIMPTHDQIYQTNLNDGDTTVWYCLADPSGTSDNDRVYDLLPNDGVNSYYIYTSGNVTYTGAGHANIFSEIEAKLFINTLVAAYRTSKEKPVVHFRDSSNTNNINYQVLTVTDRTGNIDGDTVVRPEISAVKIVDPNVNNGPTSSLVVNFYSDSNLNNPVNIGTLYTNYSGGRLGGETVSSGVGGYSVKTEVVYYFETPPQVINALKNNDSYVLYAVASVSGEDSEVKTLEYRRLALDNLS